MLISELFNRTSAVIPERARSTDIEHIAYDSRCAAGGSVFVCLRGRITDGHRYASDAYSRGCRTFVAEHKLRLPEDADVIITPDTSLALAEISAEFYGHPTDNLKIIAVTGTRGKTTTALFIHGILNAAGIKTGLISSVGVMLGDMRTSTLRAYPESADLQLYFKKMLASGISTVVWEVSSDDIYRNRVYGIKLDTCVFTNLSPEHIGEYEHPSFEHYRDTKSRLFRDFDGDFIVYNKDDAHADYMLSGAHAPSRSVSLESDADYTGHSVAPWREGGSIGVDFSCEHVGISSRIRLKTLGRFSVYNALTALAVCSHYGVSLDKAISTLENLSPLGRFEVVDALPYASFIIDYAYDARLLSSALASLREYCDMYHPSKLTVLVGAVGGRTFSRRAPIGKAVSQLADLCILTSDSPDYEDPMAIIGDILAGFDGTDTPYVCIPDRREAIEYAVREAKAGDIILLAGKGHENFQLINGEYRAFSERAIIREAAVRVLCEAREKSGNKT